MKMTSTSTSTLRASGASPLMRAGGAMLKRSSVAAGAAAVLCAGAAAPASAYGGLAVPGVEPAKAALACYTIWDCQTLEVLCHAWKGTYVPGSGGPYTGTCYLKPVKVIPAVLRQG